MGQTLTIQPANASDREPDPVLNVLIAYEDFETGKHAKQTYDFLVENIGRDCRLMNQMWKFDVLSIPKLREIAVRDATRADIIFISSHGLELPEPVTDWIESWLMEGTHCLALVSLCQKSSITRTGGVAREYLAGVARRGEMEFFSQQDKWPGADSGEAATLAKASSGVTNRTLTTLAGVVHREMTTPRWGVNE
jgi:hypothetical protein